MVVPTGVDKLVNETKAKVLDIQKVYSVRLNVHPQQISIFGV
jgi:hypothetical protein